MEPSYRLEVNLLILQKQKHQGTMKSKKIITSILVFSCLAFAGFRGSAQHVNAPIDRKVQQKWIRQVVKDLKNYNPLDTSASIPPEIINIPDYTSASFRVIGQAFIKCTNGDWVFILTNSSHENTEVGDVSIAITNRRKVRINYSHICGGIIHFKSSEPTAPESANDFFRRFIGEDEESSALWKKKRKLCF